MNTLYVPLEKIDENIRNIHKELELWIEATRIDWTKYPYPQLSNREWEAFKRVVIWNLVGINRHLNRIESNIPTINPIQVIDEMIEKQKYISDKMLLRELKERLSHKN